MDDGDWFRGSLIGQIVQTLGSVGTTAFLFVIIVGVVTAIVELRRRWLISTGRIVLVSEEDMAPLYELAERLRRPCVLLRVTESRHSGRFETCIGGPIWRPNGGTAPLDGNGTPLVFLAQINFAEMPRLEGYPSEGLLQFFVSGDNVDAPGYGQIGEMACQIDWWPAPSGGTVLAQSAPKFHPFLDETVYRDGRRLAFQPATMRPQYNDWRIEALEQDVTEGKDTLRSPAWNRVVEELDFQEAAHYVGGHPRFIQADPRSDGFEYDLVLAQFGTDDSIMWGDSGEACFLISSADCSSRNFGRVYHYWDCC